MGRPEGSQEPHVTDPWEQNQLMENICAMEDRLWGQPLHNIRRKHFTDPSYLAEDYPILHQALYELPAWSALFNYTKGETPTYKQVEKIAVFCTKAFSFDCTITKYDLLRRNLAPFPPLRTENERWKRYVGLYRGFYLYPDSLEGEEVHGSLLQLQESNGNLLCRWVTGIRRDERFGELEALLAAHPGPEFFAAFQRYNQSLPRYEGRLVCYEGVMDPAIPGYFLLKLQRKDHSNAALILLRRWSESVQAVYSGGVALVNLFQDQSKAATNAHAMVLSREKMTLTRERALMTRHLRYADLREIGLRISMDMDRNWNQALMEWSFRQEE